MKNAFKAGLYIILHIFTAPFLTFAQTLEPTPQLESMLFVTLQAQDSIAAPPPITTPQFSPRGFSQDGKHLLITVSEIGEREGEGAARRVWVYLRAINLETGSISTLAKIQGDIDWFAGSPGTIGASKISTQQPVSDNEPPWIMLGIPTNQPPPNDVLKSFTPGKFEGKAVYVAFVRVAGTGNQSQWRTFLVLRRTGSNTGTIQTYPVQLRKGELFSPQWSPDGRQVLLKAGNAGDRYNVYLMHFWNPETGELWQGPAEFTSYLLPRWSPDSRQVAYIVGGDIADRIDPFTDPMSLHVYDLQTKQSRMLARDLGSADFAWTSTNTLLYSLLSQQNLQPARAAPQNGPAQNQHQNTSRSTHPRPNIYEVQEAGGAPKLLIQGGSKPKPSPDGRWIAFFGWLDTEEARAEATTNPTSASYGPRLMLFDRTTKRRVLVRPNVFEPGTQLLWTPDGRRLILVGSRYNYERARGEARISVVTMQVDQKSQQTAAVK